MVGHEQLTVKLLERELFGLTDETEDHDPCDQVETGVETDCGLVGRGRRGCALTSSGWGHDGLHSGESHRKDTGCGLVGC